MAKQTIAIDVDDVLAAGTPSFVAYSNKRWGTNLTVETYAERWAIMWQVDIEEERKRAHEIWHSGIFQTLDRIDGVEDALKELSEHFRLVITTSRPRQVADYTKEWIDEYFDGVFEEIHHTGFYDNLAENAHVLTKGELCKSIGADFLIDDQPKHCLAAAEAGVTGLLFGDYPWNKDTDLPQNVARVHNWQQVLEYFSGRSK